MRLFLEITRPASGILAESLFAEFARTTNYKIESPFKWSNVSNEGKQTIGVCVRDEPKVAASNTGPETYSVHSNIDS